MAKWGDKPLDARGIGAWVIVAIAGGLMPGIAGLVVITIVFFKRRKRPAST